MEAKGLKGNAVLGNELHLVAILDIKLIFFLPSLDRHGSLAFTRSLGHQRIDNFCIDSVSLGMVFKYSGGITFKHL